MSPIGSNANKTNATIFAVNQNGFLINGHGSAIIPGVVPVLSVKNDIIIKNGTGQYNDPYIIE